MTFYMEQLIYLQNDNKMCLIFTCIFYLQLNLDYWL